MRKLESLSLPEHLNCVASFCANPRAGSCQPQNDHGSQDRHRRKGGARAQLRSRLLRPALLKNKAPETYQ